MPGLVPGIYVFGIEVANMLNFRRRRQIMNVKLRKIEVDDATATALEARVRRYYGRCAGGFRWTGIGARRLTPPRAASQETWPEAASG